MCNIDTSMELPGLFVAGDDSSGIHGANRLGRNGVANSTVFDGTAGDVMPAWPDQERSARARGWAAGRGAPSIPFQQKPADLNCTKARGPKDLPFQ